jgi:hypothetical protein
MMVKILTARRFRKLSSGELHTLLESLGEFEMNFCYEKYDV